jgi:hypothetical protein
MRLLRALCCNVGAYAWVPAVSVALFPVEEGAASSVGSSAVNAACLQAFRTADRRKTGTINFKALRDILDTMQKAPLTNEQFYMITADADLENSGLLEFNEYMMVRYFFLRPP